MTLFRFLVTDGSGTSDADAIDLANVEKARLEAVRMAGQMLKDLDGDFWKDSHWRLEVSDVAGMIVCAIHVSGAIPPGAI